MQNIAEISQDKKNKVQYQTFSYQDAIAYPTFFITYEFSHK